ncbi:MAG: hypothetical protein ACRD35_04495 [Candidatus Acidiferrales bacterium]
MSEHVSKAARAAGWLLILLGFSVVGVTTFTWVGTYWRQAAAGSSPSWLSLLGGLLAGFGAYAAGLFVQVRGRLWQARWTEKLAHGEEAPQTRFPLELSFPLEEPLLDEVPARATSGD